ncbi:MAG: cardiolipin synthase [Bacteroidales bacterium]|nr:cardiolipin synthase [Bacteroidales bacterium]
MTDIFNILWSGWKVLLVILVIVTILFIIFQKGDPSKTIAWISIIIMVPFIGILLFIIFGRVYKRKRKFWNKEVKDAVKLQQYYKELYLKPASKYTSEISSLAEHKSIINLLKNNSKSLLGIYNDIKIFHSGKDKFEYLLVDLGNAKHHIHLDYYIIEEGEIFNKIIDVLIKKVKEGVKVRIIYDDVGSWGLSNALIKKLIKNNIEIYPFLPVRFPRFAQRLLFRNHRKIVVIDGKIGYTGGMNIADRYIYGRKDSGIWRDTHIRIEGESVNSLQVIFLTDWFFVSKKNLNNEEYFNNIQDGKICPIQIVASGPDNDWNSIMQTYFYLISNAKEYIYITSPYFIPNESILTAIKTAALSGVDVKIILPGISDSWIMFYGSYSYFPELLEAGVKIFLYKKGFIHSKVLLVDDKISSVGTANMDLRSFDQNFEVNALIYDKETTLKLKDIFNEDIQDCKSVSIEEYWGKPFTHHFAQGIARLLSPIL